MRLLDLLVSEATEYEFKSSVEIGKSKNWLKTISAFSNGLGGSIFFGVDKDGNPEGLDDIQKTAEQISQLISVKIQPMVFANMIPYEVENGKKILQVEIKPGLMTPYYYSSDGNKIAFVRLCEESVQAPPHILNELILKGQNQSFDALLSQYKKNDFSFTIFEATYRMRAKKKIVESDYISFKLADTKKIFNLCRSSQL